MEPYVLEAATTRLRRLLRQKVPDLLLQAECGGGLELPTPLPWGFASTPTLYELADIAERELLQEQEAQRERAARRHRRREAVDEEGRRQSDGHQAQPSWTSGQPEAARGHRSPPQPDDGEPAAREEGPSGNGRLDGFAAGAAVAQVGVGDPSAGGREAGGEGPRRDAAGAGEEEQEGVRDVAVAEPALGADAATDPRAAEGGGSGAAGAAAAGAPDDRGRASSREGRGGDSAAAPDRPGTAGRENGGTNDSADRMQQPYTELAPPLPPPSPSPPPQRPYACGAFLESLHQSRTFRSPHCEGAMAEVLGLNELYDGFGGSTLGPLPRGSDLEALRNLLKDHINARWALEAVKQGVAAAKQGNYADAHKAYTRALELDPRSAEALVARGAAHANQRCFADAERDLRHALALEPGHRNAAAYLDAVMRKVEEQRQQLEALEEERQQVLARQQQQQDRDRDRDRERERRRRTAEAGVLGDGGGDGRGTAGGEWGATRQVVAAPGRPAGYGADSRYGPQGPPSAPGRLQREQVGWQAEGGEGRRQRGSDDSSGSEASGSSSDSGNSSGGTPGQVPPLQPGSDDVRRALEVVLKARKHKKKSKHKKQKKKHKKSKRRRRD